MRETKTHFYFLGTPFSNWYEAEFELSFHKDGKVFLWPTTEHYMMAMKAELFGDENMLAAIMKTDNPAHAKAFGRKVKGFVREPWNSISRDVVYRACMAKFTQNEDCYYFILSTGDKIIVEGADYDPVWGVKLDWRDDRILDVRNWKGTNWLGQVLMKVRKDIRNGVDLSWTSIDWSKEPWK